MTTAFIVRLHYRPSPQADWRLAYFESMCLPRLRAQGEADVCVWVDNEAHWDRVERMGCKPFTVLDEYRPEAGYCKPGYESKLDRYHVDFVPWCGVVGLQRYELQVAIDSDDLLLRDTTLQRIREALAGTPEGQTAHVSIQPELLELETMRLLELPVRYSVNNGSAVYALLQPASVPDDQYVFAYDDSHHKIGRRMQNRYFIDATPSKCFVAASVHNWNESTKVSPNAREIVRRR